MLWETMASPAATCHGCVIDLIESLGACLPLQPATG
jgi:hypothetical protein